MARFEWGNQHYRVLHFAHGHASEDNKRTTCDGAFSSDSTPELGGIPLTATTRCEASSKESERARRRERRLDSRQCLSCRISNLTHVFDTTLAVVTQMSKKGGGVRAALTAHTRQSRIENCNMLLQHEPRSSAWTERSSALTMVLLFAGVVCTRWWTEIAPKKK